LRGNGVRACQRWPCGGIKKKGQSRVLPERGGIQQKLKRGTIEEAARRDEGVGDLDFNPIEKNKIKERY